MSKKTYAQVKNFLNEQFGSNCPVMARRFLEFFQGTQKYHEVIFQGMQTRFPEMMQEIDQRGYDIIATRTMIPKLDENGGLQYHNGAVVTEDYDNFVLKSPDTVALQFLKKKYSK